MTPRSGRELAEWLSVAGRGSLVSVSGVPRSGRGKPSNFIGVIDSWNGVSIVVKPADGSTPAAVPLPAGWMTGAETPVKSTYLDDHLAFADDGFNSFGVTVRYLDQENPFK